SPLHGRDTLQSSRSTTDATGYARIRRMLPSFWQDLRYGCRALGREPVFTAAAVVTLALGIGANAAIFGLIDSVLFRPFPVRDPGRLAAVYTWSATEARLLSTSYPDYLDFRDQPALFDGTLAYVRIPVGFNAGQRTELLSAEGVTEGYFD